MDVKKAGETHDALYEGDVVSDDDLKNYVEVCAPTVEVLSRLGAHFHLAWKELSFTVDKAQSYLRERERAGVTYIATGVRGKVKMTRNKIPQSDAQVSTKV